MKKLLITLLLPMMTATANAGLITRDLCDIVAGAACLQDTGDEFFSIIDVDGVTDTITSFAFSRNASLGNSFGFYDPFDTGNVLELFGTSDPAISATTVFWDGTSFSTASGSATFSTGGAFGVYSENTQGDIWFSDELLNGGDRHFGVFETLGMTPGVPILNVSNLTWALEDLPGLGDQDWNDLLVTCTDCSPIARPDNVNEVPEPATGLLFGIGAAGLVAMRRKKAAVL